MIELLQQLVNGLAQGAIYALIAIGYTMVFGVLRFINFAHGDVYMLGAYAGLYTAPALIRICGGPGLTSAAAVLATAILICAAVGVLIERICYRPLRHHPRLSVLITAIGVSLLLESGGQFCFGADPRAFPDIIADSAIDLPAALGCLSQLTVTYGQLIVFISTAILLFALRTIVYHTRIGMAMRALSLNPVAASLMGVNTDFILSVTFMIGSAMAGAAAILTSIQQPSIDPLMGINAGLKAFVAAVLGGIGSIPGAALGGVIIGLLEALVVGYINPTYRDPLVFAVLILVLLLRPTGLLGRGEREKV